MSFFSLEEGKKLVKLARDTIKFSFENKEIKLENSEKRGVFVTIHTHKDHQLRGCIGFPEPVLPLNEAIIQAAKSSAFSDPRFLPLRKEELDNVIIEVSILTLPELVKVEKSEEYLEKIKIGRDGLIAGVENFRGLLLPQVPVEQKWGVEEFLNQVCLKAGLLEDTWKQDNCKLYSFRSQVFLEKEPNGEIIESRRD
ncbi:AMMECR1 domain-containing protein [archaeon]|nr:AMMECR1 domain-containing protein [archaeon]